MADAVSFLPTAGCTYDPADDHYWDADALGGELNRAFALCHSCRMCFKYCDSFPTLFDLIDEHHDGDPTKLTPNEIATVMDQCFQCKLCEVQCPYTPRDGHEFQLDFPKLVHRYDAQRARERGVPLREKVLGNPDGTAKLARASQGLANVANRTRLHRIMLEKVLGVHRDAELPDFAARTFEAWAERMGFMTGPHSGEVVLFATCYVNNHQPEIGRDTIDVLQANQVPVTCEKGLDCCGMPAWEHGDLEAVQRHARTNLSKLLPHVRAGKKVLAINPTCSMMLRREYPTLVATEMRADAEQLAVAVMDPSEFLWSIRKEDRFNSTFAPPSTAGSETTTIAYHAPCHLRAQGIGFKGRDLMRKLPGVSVNTTMECCGHDGTFGMTVQGYEASIRIGTKAFAEMQQAGATIWATDCPLAAVQFGQHAGTTPMHPMTILARAYRDAAFIADDTPRPAV